MWLYMAVGVGLGALFGGLVLSGGKCAGGACSITSSRWAGVVGGAVLGGIIGMWAGIRQAPAGGDLAAYEAIPTINSQQQFEQQVLKSDKPVLVDFFIDGCVWCEKLAPSIGTLSREYQGKAKFFRLNANNVPQVAGAYGIDGVPTVLIFHTSSGPGGDKPITLVGMRDIDEYRRGLR